MNRRLCVCVVSCIVVIRFRKLLSVVRCFWFRLLRKSVVIRVWF